MGLLVGALNNGVLLSRMIMALSRRILSSSLLFSYFYSFSPILSLRSYIDKVPIMRKAIGIYGMFMNRCCK